MKTAQVTVLFLSGAALLSCASPKITKHEAATLPPYALCKEYKRWSDAYASPAVDVDRERTAESLKMLYAIINERNIDCHKELQIDTAKPERKGNSIVNCFPNQATGGITCF